jgi:hypothetical protein
LTIVYVCIVGLDTTYNQGASKSMVKWNVIYSVIAAKLGCSAMMVSMVHRQVRHSRTPLGTRIAVELARADHLVKKFKKDIAGR